VSVITTSIALIQLALSAVMVAGLPAPDVAQAGSEALEQPARHRSVGADRVDTLAAGETDLGAVLPAKRDPRLFRRDI